MLGDPEVVEEVMDRHLLYLERRCEAQYGRARIRGVPRFLIGGAAARQDGA
jgi:hypothetical protein